MFDIGFGEMLLLAVGALLVFGPDRLPRSAADFVQTIRKFQAMAKNARQTIVDVAGVDLAEGKDALKEFSDLHPRRLLNSVLHDGDEGSPKSDTAPRNLPIGYVRAAEARKAQQNIAQSPPSDPGVLD